MKKKILIILVIIMSMSLAACKDEIPEDVSYVGNKYENPYSEEILEMSKELNRVMFTTPDIRELALKFDSYKDKMSETVYLTHFNAHERDVALMYYYETGVAEYTELETVLVERNKDGILTTDIYVIFKIELDITGDSEETSDGYLLLNGVNKYTYSGDKLVNFKRIHEI